MPSFSGTPLSRVAALAMLALLIPLGGCEPPDAGAAPSAATPAQDSARSALIARADLARIKGAATAPVWLVVVSDFQCPFCKQWHDETAARIDREYVRTGKVRVAYLNYPISSHRNARPAHEVAMCAAEQDAFWPMADALFATQGDWKDRGDPRAFFDSLAGTLPLDHARLRRCVQEGTLRSLIQADVDRVISRGVGSTPTFFAGSYALVGAQPFAAFKQALDRALADALAAAPADRP